MPGIALLYFFGKYFYTLAALNGKNKCGYGILGVVSYYAGTILFGITLEPILQFGFDSSVDTINENALGIVSLPAGIGFAPMAYHLLKKHWEKKSRVNPGMIEQIGADIS